MFKVAQIIGIFAIIMYALSLHKKNKAKVIIYRVISNLFYATEFLLLDAFSAMGTSIVDAIQTIIFYKYAKKKEKIPICWVILYIIIIITIGFFTYKNVISLFPIVLSIIGAYGIWQDNLKVNRLITVSILPLWMIYNFLISAYINVIGNIFQLFSAVIALYRFNDIKFFKNIKELNNNRKTNSKDF